LNFLKLTSSCTNKFASESTSAGFDL